MTLSLTIPRAVLLPVVARTIKIVERRNTVPILAHLVLSVDPDGAVTVSATDLDIWIHETVPAGLKRDSRPGATALPAGLLHDVLRKLPDGEVKIAGDEKGARVTVSAGRARFAVNCLAADDLPAMPTVIAESFRLDPTALSALKDAVAFAISTEETRYYLNGIYLHTIETDAGLMLRGVATDGHRLSRLDIPAPDGAAGRPGVIVPRKTATTMIDLLVDVAGQGSPPATEGSLRAGQANRKISIAIDERSIAFEAGPVRLVSKLIDGKFPDYQRVIPAAPPFAVTLDRADLAAAIDRVATVSAERGRAVKWTVTPNELRLEVTSPDAGEAAETLAAETNGEPAGPGWPESFVIGFNARYTAELLATLDGKTVAFHFSGPGDPATVTDPSDPSRTLVLMPMRVV